jgi:hypothetical protein
MAKEVLELEVKSNIGEVTKGTKELTNEASSAVGEFRFMGVSLNGVKKAFASAAVTAKGMFSTIKAGLISTGIGAFVVLIGSLVAYFKSTKEGAEKLERAMAGFGAVVSVITDRLSAFGEVIVSAFEDPQQAVKDLWEAIKTNIVNRVEGLFDVFGALGDTIKAAFSLDWEGVKAGAADFTESMIQAATGVDDLTGKMAKGFKSLGDEIEKDVAAAMRLKGMLQQLKDEEREFSKVRAQTRQDIQKARLDALDESKTAEERLAAVQKANDLELKTTEDVLKMQRRKIEVQKATMALSENMAEDLDELASLEVELIDLQTASFQTQKRLATEMETLTNEIAAKDKERAKEKQDQIAAELKATQDLYDAQIAQALAWEAKVIAYDEAVIASKLKMTSAVGSAIGALGGLMEEGSAAQKATALTEIAVNTGVGFVQGLNIAQKSAAAAGPGAALAFPIFYATQIAAVLGAAAQAKTILGAGGGVTPPSTPPPSTTTPAPQMMSGAFQLGGGVKPEPLEAYVITDKMTSSQNQLANIRRRATI